MSTFTATRGLHLHTVCDRVRRRRRKERRRRGGGEEERRV